MRATTSLFAGIAAPEVESAVAGLERRTHPAGAILIAEGDYLSEMYVLTAGTAEISIAGRTGRTVVGSVGPGEAVGEMSLLTGEPASATVRAVDEVDLLVLRDAELDALTQRLPRIQRNIVAALSARLAGMTRLAHDHARAPVVLEGPADQALLGYALAASIAWHTQGRVLAVVVADRPPEVLAPFAALAEPPPRPPARRGAQLVVARPEGAFEPARIRATLAQVAGTFDHVLIHVSDASQRASLGPPVVRLGASTAPEGAFALEAVATTERAPYDRRHVRVPPFEAEDERALQAGSLSLRTPAGRGVGRLARELALLKVGVALGSGSVRGWAHVGALRGLERLGVPVDCLAGASVGAIVGGAYVYFDDLDRVTELLDELGKRAFRPTLSRRSLLSTRAMRRYVRSVVGDGLLEELPIPVGIVATDVDTHEEVVLRRGSGVTALFASSAVPGVFPAVRVGNRTLVDGGIVNPVPASAAEQLGANVVIAVRLMSGGGVEFDHLSEEAHGPLPTAVANIVRSIELVQTRMPLAAGAAPTIVVAPEFAGVPAAKLRQFRAGRRYIDAGERAVEAAVPRLATALPWLRTP